MGKAAPTARDTSIATYRAKRDFARTAEPAPAASPAGEALLFVVQKHAATRLHWDFRLEHGGVLWSWAVPRGPSMDPHDKRLAVHVEDHPVEYARFEGDIPAGNYGAGHVDIWDRGHWRAMSDDPAADLARGEMKFVLAGERLQGRFVLIRLKPRPREHAENWLLIKEHDEHESPGTDAAALERTPLPKLRQGAGKPKAKRKQAGKPAPVEAAEPAAMATPATQREMPADAVARKFGATPKPQLASAADIAPDGGEWISEIKFDGYRLLARRERGVVQLITRNGLDWTARLPAIAAAIAGLGQGDLLLDGELVALQPDGVSSFHALQAALRDKRDDTLFFYAFDLLHLDGHDLAPCPLADRKAVLAGLADWTAGLLRYSDHVAGDAARVRKQACTMGLEGVICKRADAPYRPGRGRDWLKIKCQGREEFVVLGWTKPQGARSGLGSLHLGFYDPEHRLHYVGGCGSGFADADLDVMSERVKSLASPPPKGLLLTEEKPPTGLNWVRPELVIEVQYIGWSGAGRLRHAVFLGLREDKPAAEVVRDVPDPEAKRITLGQRPTRIVNAKPPVQRGGATEIGGVRLTHPERELWPGITKQDLATYWQTVAQTALPGIADRPLALVRCPDGIDGEHFFQKHALRGMAEQLREGDQDGAPYLALRGQDGLIAATQMSAIELHGWGSHLPDAGRADRLVFDLDPGEGVEWPQIIRATLDVRDRLEREGFVSYCRTSGGKGLHVVAPLRPDAGWDQVRAWCRRFAERMEAEQPSLYVASVPKAKRTGRILVDWLRNGLGSTAVCSFSPRARPGAGVATPLHWREVGPKLDVTAWTLKTVPGRLAKLRADPWAGFAEADQRLPAEAAPARKRR